jgi:hypothetical protein
MADVTFKWDCPQSLMTVTIQSRETPGNIAGLNCQGSGTKKLDLSEDIYDVGYRAVGTPNTNFALEVTKGGTMNPIDRPLADDGKAAGVRKLTVP